MKFGSWPKPPLSTLLADAAGGWPPVVAGGSLARAAAPIVNKQMTVVTEFFIVYSFDVVGSRVSMLEEAGLARDCPWQIANLSNTRAASLDAPAGPARRPCRNDADRSVPSRGAETHLGRPISSVPQLESSGFRVTK